MSELSLLSRQMVLEPSGGADCPDLSARQRDALAIGTAQLPNGKQIRLLKTLLSSACERDCFYCPFRAGRDFRRATFQPEAFARAFLQLHRARRVDGLFLSSGVFNGGVFTQDKLLAVAEILRRQMHYRGYLHLKLMPGAEKAQVEAAMRLADRVSVNLEAPDDRHLRRLAPHKDFAAELARLLRWVEEIRREQDPHEAWNGRWPSSVTQFVVGAAGERDLDLLSVTQQLHRQAGLRRAYFSAFRPIADTPLEHLPPAPLLRQNRLYQASFLLRDYGFDLEDLPFAADGSLPLDRDPKTAWAEAHLRHAPVEVNTAPRHVLLHVPGIGPKGADAILRARRVKRLCDLSQLRKLGVNTARAADFVLLDGKPPARQLAFAL